MKKTDIEYLRHGDEAFLARIYRPEDSGPFPMLVDLHGGHGAMAITTTTKCFVALSHNPVSLLLHWTSDNLQQLTILMLWPTPNLASDGLRHLRSS